MAAAATTFTITTMAATIAVAVTMAIATVATTATAVTAMATAMMLLALLDEVVDFLLGSGAVLDDASLEMEILACERMVHIHRHRVVVHRDDIAKTLASSKTPSGENIFLESVARPLGSYSP